MDVCDELYWLMGVRYSNKAGVSSNKHVFDRAPRRARTKGTSGENCS